MYIFNYYEKKHWALLLKNHREDPIKHKSQSVIMKGIEGNLKRKVLKKHAFAGLVRGHMQHFWKWFEVETTLSAY